MYGYQIEQELRHFPEVYKNLRGIISIDKVPPKLKKLEFVIINQSLSNSEGTHWCVLFRDLR